MHKIHAPCLICLRGHVQWGWGFPVEPFLGLDPEVKLKLTVNAINTLMVSVKALHVTQIQKTQLEAPISLAGG